ncbi:LOW QUALITY PROTEIN: cadherin-24-like [Acipenser ruthenus]|uniref:LOW QUALITY PROTEIN: cadherin-24-like n=1 Tax=Acipenser ruthenus TaxID=7906 RepID=UPI002741F7FF|nr:LOW QUALITY PROTEIN: cadherin-24-like [Acipenser ruthenus]
MSGENAALGIFYPRWRGGGSPSTSPHRRRRESLTLNQPLDFERRQSFVFRVEVVNTYIDPCSCGAAPFKDVATVRVAVLDANEPPPASQSPHYSMGVQENSPPPDRCGGAWQPGTPDTAGAMPIRFFIDPHSDPERLFSIDPRDGTIRTTTELDRESSDWHNITVIATEMNSPAQSSRALVAIRTLDLNDNPPELQHGFQVAVCDNAKPGQLVQVIGAVDQDEQGDDSRIHFKLLPDSATEKNFTVKDNRDNTASLLLLSPFPSRPHLSPVFVPVVVWDSGQPPLSSTGTVTVSVCECGQGRDSVQQDSVHPGLSSCRPLQLASPATGLSTGALLAILACIATLLAIACLFVSLRRQKHDSLSVFEDEDVRENIITYDDEGGGEEDTEAFDISALQNPDGAGPGTQTRWPRKEGEPAGVSYGSSTMGYQTRSVRKENGPASYDNGTAREDNGSTGFSNGTMRKDSSAMGFITGTMRKDSSAMGFITGTMREDNGSMGFNNGTMRNDNSAANSQAGTLRNEGSAPGEGTAGVRRQPDLSAQSGPPESMGTAGTPSYLSCTYPGGGGGMGGGYFLARQDVKPAQFYVAGRRFSGQILGFACNRGERLEVGGFLNPPCLVGRPPDRGLNPGGLDGRGGELCLSVSEFLRLRLVQADCDPSLTPYDSIQVYGYEGEGSLAGSLSSLGSEGSRGAGEGGPEDWGPRFEKLADLYGAGGKGEGGGGGDVEAEVEEEEKGDGE